MIINRQKNIEFNSTTDVIFEPDELKKAILWYSNKPVARLKHIYLHGNYYAVSIYEEKIHIHRLLMMYWMKRDLQTNEYVHHKNGNKFNNLKENLEIISSFEHQRLTNKGRKHTAEHNYKIGLANKKRKGMKYHKNLQKS